MYIYLEGSTTPTNPAQSGSILKDSIAAIRRWLPLYRPFPPISIVCESEIKKCYLGLESSLRRSMCFTPPARVPRLGVLYIEGESGVLEAISGVSPENDVQENVHSLTDDDQMAQCIEESECVLLWFQLVKMGWIVFLVSSSF